MAKFGVKIYYETYCYKEVEAESREDAIDKALNAIDTLPYEVYQKEIIRNLTNVNDPEIFEIN